MPSSTAKTLAQKAIKRMTTDLGYTAVLIVLAFVCTAAESTNIEMSVLGFLLRAAAYAFMFILGFVLICRFILTRPSHKEPHLHTVTLKRTALYASIIFLCWLPILIVLYPGITFSDTSSQLCQFFGNPPEYGAYCIQAGSAFSDHHPLADTLIMGSIVQIGMMLGSANIGFMVLVLAQSALLSLSIGRALCHVAVWNLWSRRSVYLTIAFFSIFPAFPYMAASPVKDTIFMIAFLSFIIEYARLMRGDCKGLVRPLFFLAITFLMILTKRTGLYVAILCLLGGIIFNRRAWKQLLLTLVPSIVAAGIVFPAIAFPLLNVSPGSKNEMLGFFYQQTARFVSVYPHEVTDQERQTIDSLLHYDTLAERYNPDIVDMVNHADGVEYNPSTSQVSAYIRVFLAQLMRHPENNVIAMLSQESGWFDISQHYQVALNYDMAVTPDNGTPNIYRPAWIRPAANALMDAINTIAELPIVGVLFIPALYTTLIPLYCVLLGMKTKRLTNRQLSCLVPVLASLPLLWISPVSLASVNLEAFRYTLPFLYTAPFTIGFALARPTEEQLTFRERAV